MILKKLFDEFNNNEVRYCVLRKYKTLPKKPNGDVDICIEKKTHNRAINIIERLGFLKYPFVYPHEFYFHYERELIKLDLVKKRKIKNIRKHKNFYIPNGWYYRIKKGLILKIITFTLRKFYWFNKGRLICFSGPDGVGKTSVIMSAKEKLRGFPIKKRYMRFGTSANNKLKRSCDLIKKIARIEISILSGEIIFCDRYMYLTFRNHPLLRKVLFYLMRKPDITYFLKNSAKEIHKRKKEISLKEIRIQLRLFEELSKQRKEFKNIRTDKTIGEISNKVAKDILFKW